MKAKRRIPDKDATIDDGTPDAYHIVDGSDDTEGHVVAPASSVYPGTGGDFNPRHPSTGGEFVDENDVEGHTQLTTNPGTGGDISPRHPSTGGEFIDENDVEGHMVAPTPSV